jgi:hypothetical protein
MGTSDASASVDIAAPPDRVYGLITDLGTLTELAEETASMRWAKGGSAAPGAVFRGTNRNGWRRWTTTCLVTDAEPGRCFAFNVSHTKVPIARWQYDIETTDLGCRVTESTWDRRPSLYGRLAGLATGTSDRGGLNAEHIEATLRRLKQRAEAG